MADCSCARCAARQIMDMKPTPRWVQYRDLMESGAQDFEKAHILIHLVEEPDFAYKTPYEYERICATAARFHHLWFASSPPVKQVGFTQPYGIPYRDAQGELKFHPFERDAASDSILFFPCANGHAVRDAQDQQARAVERAIVEGDAIEGDAVEGDVIVRDAT